MKTRTSLAFDAMSGTAGEVTARSTRFGTILSGRARQPGRVTPQQKDMRALFARVGRTIKTVNGYLIVVVFQEDRIIDSSIAIICNVDVRKIEELLQGMGAKAGDYPWGVLGIDDGRVEGIPFIFIKYVKT